MAIANVCGICQMNNIKKSIIGTIWYAEVIVAQPINGVTAPETLPITVFSVYLRFVQNVYKNTYVNQPINPYTAASNVVKNKSIKPNAEAAIPKVKTA